MGFWDWVLGGAQPGGELPLGRGSGPHLPADRRGVPFPRRIRQAVLVFHGPALNRLEAERLVHVRLPWLGGRVASDFKLLVTTAGVTVADGDDSTLGSALLLGLKEDPDSVHQDLAPVASYLATRSPMARPPMPTLEYWTRELEARDQPRATIYLIGDMELMLIKLRMMYGSID